MEEKYHEGEVAKGVILQNYVTKTPSDDGMYVTITTHTERIEKIKQPPTPEEIQEAKELMEAKRQDEIRREKAEMRGLMTVLGFFGAVLGFAGYLAYKDDQKVRQQVPSVKAAE